MARDQSSGNEPAGTSIDPSEGTADKPKKTSLLHRLLVLGGCLAVGLVTSAFATLIMWLKNTNGLKEESASYIVPFIAGLGLFFGLLLLLAYSSASPSPELAQPTPSPKPGRHKRGYRPPRPIDTLDDDLAAALTPAQWSQVAHRLRRRRPRRLALRIAMFPVVVFGIVVSAGYALADWARVLPTSWVHSYGPFIGAVLVAGWLTAEVRNIVDLWRRPMLLVRGVVADTELVGSADPKEASQEAAGIEYTAIVLVQPRIDLLSPEGVLRESPLEKHSGMLEAVAANDTGPRRVHLRSSRRLAKRFHERDRAAVLCLGDKRAVARLRDLLSQGEITTFQGQAPL